MSWTLQQIKNANNKNTITCFVFLFIVKCYLMNIKIFSCICFYKCFTKTHKTFKTRGCSSKTRSYFNPSYNFPFWLSEIIWATIHKYTLYQGPFCTFSIDSLTNYINLDGSFNLYFYGELYFTLAECNGFLHNLKYPSEDAKIIHLSALNWKT